MPQQPTGKRKPLSAVLRQEVLAEAGYRCAVPTCRSILALDIHHIIAVEEGGPHALSNLLALCPTCHALYTRGIISREAIHVWKMMLVALNHAFDTETINHLLFLQRTQTNEVVVSGDGVLHFSHLIATGLARPHIMRTHGPWFFYVIRLTPKGQCILDSWCSGDRERMKQVLSNLTKEQQK